jgi:hypothetical protein
MRTLFDSECRISLWSGSGVCAPSIRPNGAD